MTSGTAPPSGVNESCIELTAPQDAAVVIVAKRAESAIPKRASLPSMLPSVKAVVRTLVASVSPTFASSGLPCCSKLIAPMAKLTKSRPIAANTVQPWRSSPTMQPKAMHSAPGIRKIDSICRKFTNGVGFSNG
ncbi:MAG: hypothetical protein AW07_01993 [Candidatus Accumulibacter sp. SK-11]|nr:MAG: hypothetical protein AW07_01993 [Candidatus Accumulibacter sp. SK-11]